MNYKLKQGLIYFVAIPTIIAIPLAISFGLNRACNNQETISEGVNTYSRATGFVGHRELSLFKDGSSDLKKYSDSFERAKRESEIFQDIDGDGLVDRIRVTGPEWKMNSLQKILVRSADFEDNKQEFLDADKDLAEEKEHYGV